SVSPPAPSSLHTLSLHDALPIFSSRQRTRHGHSSLEERRREEPPPLVPEDRLQGVGRFPGVLPGRRSERRRRAPGRVHGARRQGDRKSTRLNSSHVAISYAVFCL